MRSLLTDLFSRRAARKPARRPDVRPRLEFLEDRLAPAMWSGAAGDGLWQTNGNWVEGVAPVAGGDAVIPRTLQPQTISGNVPSTLNSLELDANTLILPGGLGTNTLKVFGGTLLMPSGASLSAGTSFNMSGGVIDGNSGASGLSLNLPGLLGGAGCIWSGGIIGTSNHGSGGANNINLTNGTVMLVESQALETQANVKTGWNVNVGETSGTRTACTLSVVSSTLTMTADGVNSPNITVEPSSQMFLNNDMSPPAGATITTDDFWNTRSRIIDNGGVYAAAEGTTQVSHHITGLPVFVSAGAFGVEGYNTVGQVDSGSGATTGISVTSGSSCWLGLHTTGNQDGSAELDAASGVVVASDSNFKVYGIANVLQGVSGSSVLDCFGLLQLSLDINGGWEISNLEITHGNLHLENGSTFGLFGWMTSTQTSHAFYDKLALDDGGTILTGTYNLAPSWAGKDSDCSWSDSSAWAGEITATVPVTGGGSANLVQTLPPGYFGTNRWSISGSATSGDINWG